MNKIRKALLLAVSFGVFFGLLCGKIFPFPYGLLVSVPSAMLVGWYSRDIIDWWEGEYD